MTRKDYKALTELISNQTIYAFAERFCKALSFDPVKQYPQKAESEVMKSAARRVMYVTRTVELIRRMIFLGATKQEMLRASGYLLVMMQSIEHSLDYRACEKEMRIGELENKYNRGDFMSMNVTLDELKSVIDRDQGYYGVKIV